MLAHLQAIVRESDAESRVRFLGYLGGAEKLQAYRAAELLVIPSRQESMSIVVLEAGRAGTPVLITDQCAFGSVQTAGGGKVVGANVAQLAEGLVELLADQARLKSMAGKISEFTRKGFDWNVIIERYVELYEKLCRDYALH